MGQFRNLKLEKYGISKDRYLELKHICLQYEEYEEQIKRSTTLSHSNTVPENAITNRAKKRKDLIDKALDIICEDEPELYEPLKKSLTQEIQVKYIPMPYAVSTLYRRRRKFFVTLNNFMQ